MEDVVTQRFNEFRSSLGMSILAISKVINIGQATLNKQTKEGGCGVSILTVVKTLEAFPNLSAEWLLRGDGEMTKGADPTSHDGEYVEALKDNIASLKEVNQLLRDKINRLEGEKDNAQNYSGVSMVAEEITYNKK